MPPLYVVVRRDLKPGLKLAQACHATRALSLEHPREAVGENLVVLECDGGELARVAELAEESCTVVRFFEPDLGGELTAVAFGTGARRLLSCLPLAGRDAA